MKNKTLMERIEEILIQLYTPGYCISIKELMSELRTAIYESVDEAVKPYYRSPHTSKPGPTWEGYSSCSDCFCEIQTIHTHNSTISEIKAKLMEGIE